MVRHPRESSSLPKATLGLLTRALHVWHWAARCRRGALVSLVIASAGAAQELEVTAADKPEGCDCAVVTLRVPVPSELRDAPGVTFSALAVASGVHASPRTSTRTNTSECCADVVLRVRLPVDASLLDAADVVFRADGFGEWPVSIAIRTSALQLAVKSGDGRQGFGESPSVRSRTRGTWAVGVELGAVAAELAGSTAGLDDARVGGSGLAFAEYALGSEWSLRGGIGYAQRGGASRAAGVSTVLAVDYIEIPLEVRRPVGRLGGVTGVGSVGAVAAMVTNCSLVARTGTFTLGGPCDADLGGGNPRPADVGLYAGLAAEIALGELLVDIGSRYIAGFVSYGLPLDVRNRGFSLSTAVRWTLGSDSGCGCSRSTRTR